MRELNLLPGKQKKDLSFSVALRVVTFFSYWLIGAVVVFGVLLLPAYFFITFQKQEVARTKISEEELSQVTRIDEVARETGILNDRIRAFNERTSQKLGMATLIRDVLERAPAGVSVSFLSYKADTREMRMNGTAATRTLFLGFADALRAMPEVLDISSPVANLIQEQDVNFTLTLRLDP